MTERDLNRTLVMRMEQAPFTYGGESCDEHEPRWYGYAVGDKDSDSSDEVLMLAKHFPPGTVVRVEEPLCPECGEPGSMALDYETGKMRNCQCGFDWREWAEVRYG